MTLFDDAVAGVANRARGASLAGRAMAQVRQLRDKRVRAHVVGCFPLQKKQGLELVLYTDSNLWAQEFQLNAAAILAEWNMRCAQGQPDLVAVRLRFQVSSRVHARPATDDVPRDVYAPAALPELSPAEQAWVAAQVSCISSPELKEKARKTLEASLRWKKSKRP